MECIILCRIVCSFKAALNFLLFQLVIANLKLVYLGVFLAHPANNT